eukprot:GHVQ01041712.1.p2 GENE.GHVQ01041712.1~~GHVQ01041712.1.p2  ORF type:complete len:104 (+),score=15.69 GHVQ01041712.1:307-618(+)
METQTCTAGVISQQPSKQNVKVHTQSSVSTTTHMYFLLLPLADVCWLGTAVPAPACRRSARELPRLRGLLNPPPHPPFLMPSLMKLHTDDLSSILMFLSSSDA